MIEVTHLTKRYGRQVVVDDVSFHLKPGTITGLLGPNGAGKSTIMRMIVGLDAPTRGSATVSGRPYRRLETPLRHAAALLDPTAMHPARSGRDHLRILARTQGLTDGRVDEVLEVVGIESAARKKMRTLSLGMRQRVGIAGALLSDPRCVILDEPVNGLDPEGIIWVRTLLRELAAEGRTILLSSHLMNEMSMTAERILVLGKGRLLADGPLHEVASEGQTLEEAFIALTQNAVEYRSTGKTLS